MTDERKSQHDDERVEDLDIGEEEARGVVGGKKVRKAGGNQQEYYEIKLEDVLISGYQSGGSEGSNAK